MAAKLVPTPEQTAAFASEGPVLFVNAQGNTTHVALPVEEARRLLVEHLQRELAPALDDERAGRIEPWDIERTIAEAKRRTSGQAKG